jgi:probable phosphoglycerate mutase
VIVFARHGQTVPNREGRLLGRSDPELTERGREQAGQLAPAIAGYAPTAVYSSPLLRARQTAEAIADVLGLAVVVDDDLIEIDYGDWEGKPFGELDAGVVAQWRADSGYTPPGGESLRDVEARVGAFCERRLGADAVVAVSHVSPIKGAVTWCLGLTAEKAWRMRLDVASITRIAPGPTLLSFNETAHLAAR